MSDDRGFNIFTPPINAGYFRIGGSLTIHLAQRPNWLARKMSKWLLEWEWFDKEQAA